MDSTASVVGLTTLSPDADVVDSTASLVTLTALSHDDGMQGHKSSSRKMFKNAGITTVLVGLGVASGLILDALILGTFGLGYQTDAFFTALAIPLLLTSVFSVQCPRVLIPVFADYSVGTTRSVRGDCSAT
jgi:hypothetical protein